MTGAGFGGSTVNIVPKDKLDRFRENVTEDYKNETGIIPDIFVIHPEAGTHEIK
jgi:galactokinase